MQHGFRSPKCLINFRLQPQISNQFQGDVNIFEKPLQPFPGLSLRDYALSLSACPSLRGCVKLRAMRHRSLLRLRLPLENSMLRGCEAPPWEAGGLAPHSGGEALPWEGGPWEGLGGEPPSPAILVYRFLHPGSFARARTHRRHCQR